MSTTIASEHTLKITRFIKAPQARVFEAWTKPDQVMRWMGPKASYLLSAKLDLRAGGEYHFHMKTDGCGCDHEARTTWVSGVYREVNPHSRLAFTWGWVDDATSLNDTTLVTLDFDAVEGGTQLTLTHSGFPDETTSKAHNQGWDGTLDKLERMAAKEACMGWGQFGWNELCTTNTSVAGAFYSKLFGWDAVAMPMPGPDGTGEYTMFKNQGMDTGGMLQCDQPGIPSHWLPYILVENIQESTDSAEKLGAKIVVRVKDIGIGKLSVIIDPTGAGFGIFQPTME